MLLWVYVQFAEPHERHKWLRIIRDKVYFPEFEATHLWEKIDSCCLSERCPLSLNLEIEFPLKAGVPGFEEALSEELAKIKQAFKAAEANIFCPTEETAEPIHVHPANIIPFPARQVA